ncbi:MAG TPA: recombinase family protein [Mycobacterium sp.]|nr:recombinase family protein [Mycobacterium sp.]
MTDATAVGSDHLRRAAFVYIRQSSLAQVENNTESTRRQYALVDKALGLGWPRGAVSIVDDDLGLSGAQTTGRSGFAHMATEIAMGRVGIVLCLEVSRLARNNADWYRLLDLCALTRTLIADTDGLYHPGDFNDRLVLGLKGTMSEAELHILRARLDGGIRHKAARGELRRGLPTGYVWGEADGEILFHPDEAVVKTISSVFERFAETGSARRVWLWFRSNGLLFPLQDTRSLGREVRWVVPTYHAIHGVLIHPCYAGAYTYGRTRFERYVDGQGNVRSRSRRLPRDEWAVLIRGHHRGFIDWETFEANRMRIDTNTRPRAHQAADLANPSTARQAPREGAALLQGLAACGHCGRRLRTHYRGRNARPGYHCAGKNIVEGRGHYCLNVGGCQIDAAVADAFLTALQPAGMDAALAAAERMEARHDAALEQWRLEVDRRRYEASLAERRYQAVDPDNRLVARGLEAQWELRLRELGQAQAEMERRQQQAPRALTETERQSLFALGRDVRRAWSAPATTDRDRKELLHALVDEVTISVNRPEYRALLAIRWKSNDITRLEVALPRSNPPTRRTDDETIDVIRRLAVHHTDGVIAGILNRQGRRTVSGDRFTAGHVQGLRHHRGIPCRKPPSNAPDGELASVRKAAEVLNLASSTILRWIEDGFIPAEQPTPGAPWQIRVTDDLLSRFVEETPAGFIPMIEATKRLGVSRQTVLQRVKRGELQAVHIRQGRRKGLRIKVPDIPPDLFTNPPGNRG